MKQHVQSISTADLPATTPSPDSDVMKLPEAAIFLRCHPETVKKMAKRGTIPSRRIGSGWRFSRVALTRWMQNDQNQNKAA